MTIFIKKLHGYPASVQTFYSQLVAAAILTPVIIRSRGRLFRIHGVWLLLARSLASAIGVILSYYAFQRLPLAEANTLSFTRVLWIAPLAAIFLGDRVGWREWMALGVGFAGVLIVLRPVAVAPGPAQLAAIASALLIALSVTGIKMLTRRNSVSALLACSAFLTLAITAVPAFASWRWPSPQDLWLLLGLGLLNSIAMMTYIKGMSLGDPAKLAPVDYIRLPFAVLAGAVAFHQWPDAPTILGALVIIVAAFWGSRPRSPKAAGAEEMASHSP